MTSYDTGFENTLRAVGIDKLAALQGLEKEAAMPKISAGARPGALRRAWDFFTKGRNVSLPSATAAQASQTGSRVSRQGAQRAFESRTRAAVPEAAAEAATGIGPWKKRALIGAGALGGGAALYGASKKGLLGNTPNQTPQNAYYPAYY